MIKIVIHKAIHNDISFKNSTFLEGELYFGRMSKDGNSYVLMSEEGYWIPLIQYHWAKNERIEDSFEYYGKFYCDNYKSVNYIDMLKQLDKIRDVKERV